MYVIPNTVNTVSNTAATGYVVPGTTTNTVQKYHIQPTCEDVTGNSHEHPAFVPQGVYPATNVTRENFKPIVADIIDAIQACKFTHPLRMYMFNLCAQNKFANQTFVRVVEHVLKAIDTSYIAGLLDMNNMVKSIADIIVDSTFCCAVTIYDKQIQLGDPYANQIYLDEHNLAANQAGRNRAHYYAQVAQRAAQVTAHQQQQTNFNTAGTNNAGFGSTGAGVNGMFVNNNQHGVSMKDTFTSLSDLPPERLLQLGLNPAKYIPGWSPTGEVAQSQEVANQPQTPTLNRNVSVVFDSAKNTQAPHVHITEEDYDSFTRDFIEIRNTFDVPLTNQETSTMQTKTEIINIKPTDWKDGWALFDPLLCDSHITTHPDGTRTQKIVYKYDSMGDFDPRLEMLDPFIEEYNKVHPEYHYVPYVEYNRFRQTMSPKNVEDTIAANIGVISRRISPDAMENAKAQALEILRKQGEEASLQESLNEAKKVELETADDVMTGINIGEVATRSLTENYPVARGRGRRRNARQRVVTFEPTLANPFDEENSDDTIPLVTVITKDIVKPDELASHLSNDNITEHLANKVNDAATEIVNDVLIGEFNTGWTIDSFANDWSDLVQELKEQDGGIALANSINERVTRRLSGLWSIPEPSVMKEWDASWEGLDDVFDEDTVTLSRDIMLTTIDSEPGKLVPVNGSSTITNVDRYNNPYLFEQLRQAIGDFDRKSTRNNMVQFTSGKLYRVGYNFYNQEVIYLSLVN